MLDLNEKMELVRAIIRGLIILTAMVVFTILALKFMTSVDGEWDAEHMTLLALIIGYISGVMTTGAAFYYGSKDKE